MKIAVVSGFLPYPPIFGGAIDVWERIKGLVSLGHDVDLIVTDKYNPTQQQIDEMLSYVNNVYFVLRENRIQQIINQMPLQMISRKGLARIEVYQEYDLMILESEFCWAVTLNETIHYKKIVVRVHNIESFYFKMLGKSSSSLKDKIYYKIETSKIKKLSSLVFEKSDKLWFISKDDLVQVHLPEKSVFMPFPINNHFVKPLIKQGNNVVFMGSLFMQNNTFGLDWYLNNVHSLIIESIPDYHLFIVGSFKEDNQKIRKKYSDIPNVSLIVNATDLNEYYQKAQLFINPMLHGSGVKVKSINALVNGLPLVSTAIGTEGIGLSKEMYYHADTINTFKEQILSVLEHRNQAIEKTELAQEYLKKTNYIEVLKNELDAFN